MKAHYCVALCVIACGQATFGQGSAAAVSTSSAPNPALAANYGRLPLSFEANEGQSGSGAKFVAHGNGYALFLTGNGAVLALSGNRKSALRGDAGGPGGKTVGVKIAAAAKTGVLRMELVGAELGKAIEGVDRLPGTANYFLGKDPAKWRSNMPTFAKVKYTGIYPGVDLVYYGNQRQLEYDFVVAPGAGARQLQLRFAGVKGVKLNSAGDLVLSAPSGDIAFHKPVVYQMKNGQREPVRGNFALRAGNIVGFDLGSYDHSREVVIDPTLAYATYLGGSLGDFPAAIAVDSSDNAYITGNTESVDFPTTTGALSTSIGSGYSAAFVTKLNPTGTALVYSTYLGSAANDSGSNGTAIAVDSSGAAYVTGSTYANDFPVSSGAYQSSPNDDASLFGTSFVAKLNPAGSALVYSTYLGGNLSDFTYGIAVNSAGDAYVAGQAESSDYPITKGVVQPTIGGTAGSSANAFVTMLNSGGGALVYSTFLGGSDFDGATGIALDSEEDAYVVGNACSANFPVTSGALQTTNRGAATSSCNAFVSKLNPSATALIYSTYLGGSASDSANAVAVDASGDAYVTGGAFSSNFPITTGAFQTTNKAAANQESNAFVSKLNPAGNALIYSTYLGGSGFATAMSQYIQYGEGDIGTGVALDASGDAYVTGAADSANFPVTSGAFQTTNSYAKEGQDGDAAAFLTEINPVGSALTYSSYLSGSAGAGEEAYGIATDSAGNPYIAGISSSSNFPVTSGAYQNTNKGMESGGPVGYTGFVAKFALNSATNGTGTTTSLTPSANPTPHEQTVTFTVYVSTATQGISGTVSIVIDGGSPIPLSLDSKGYATYSSDSLAVGTHAMTATYAGVENVYLASGATLSEVVESVTSRPTFTPAAGVYNLPQSVTLYTPSADSAIYYTTNGTTPTTSSPVYTMPIVVSANTTITAFAIASGRAMSEVMSATYTIDPLPAAPPTFSPAAGTYSTSKEVSLADSTSGAVIYYTLDGSTPTASSTKYKDSLTVPSTETVKAIAVAPNYLNSAVAAGTYTILVHTTTALTSSPNPSVASQAVTFTANVTADSGPVPTGTVTFANGGVGTIGTATLVNGVAKLATSSLGEGTATVNATYETSATNFTSTSPSIKQVVNK
jgi:hypothetical protein